MPTSIVLTGFAANDPVPGVYVETNFAQGAAAGADGPRIALLLANKTSAGSATPDTTIYGSDTAVPCQTEADVISLFGAGSPMHRGFRRWTAINPDTPLYFMAVTASGGTAASSTITFVNAATGNGNVRVYLDEEFVDTAVTSGDAIATIATNVAASINAKTHWPVTAGAALGVVTMTAKVAGPRGNFIRFQASISSGIATTVSPTADTAFTSGATADSNATALTNILAKRFYYIVSEAEDATQFGALVTQVNSQANPTTGIRQRAFCGAVGTISATTTIATGINAARAEIVWLKNSQWTPFELACHNAAIYALFENSGSSPRTNFAGFGGDELSSRYWKVPAPRDLTAHPTRANFVSALNNGITPVGVDARGKTYLVNRITSRSLSGSTADYRIRDAHKVTICDFFADDLQAKMVKNFSGKKIANDPAPGQPLPGPTVVTPAIYKASVFKLLDDYNDNDLLQDLALIKEATIVQRESSPTTRMAVRVPLRPVDNALQFAIAVDQVA